MNPHLTGALRHAFEELAEAAPPPAGLARTALVTARRQRITQRVAGSGIVAAVCAALVGVVAAIAPNGTADGADQFAASGGKSLAVAAYSGIRDPLIEDPSPHFLYSLLLNPKTGKYERVPYRYAMPSPDGSRVLVGTGDNSSAHPTRVGVMDRASGDVRWITGFGVSGADHQSQGYANDGRWSPDGRQILLTHQPREGTPVFVLVDPETLGTTFVPLPDLAAQSDQTLGLVWTPDSNGVALTLTRPAKDGNEAATVTGIRFYDLTGKLVRTVPASAGPLTGASFSPGGGQAALVPSPDARPQTSVTVIDPATGAVRNTFTVPQVGDLIGWADDEHLLIRVHHDAGGTGATGQSAPAGGPDGNEYDQLLVVDLTGRVDHSMRLPAEYADQLFIGSSAGLPSSATHLTF